MLKLYYARPSLFARPIWLTLLEKQIPFELVSVNLGGDQFEPTFLELNPFGHVPVLIDGDFRVIESQAILDYLEAKYPTPSLLPQAPEMLAKVRMVQFVALNELLPAIVGLLLNETATADFQYAEARVGNTLRFLEGLLGDASFFAGEPITLAETVAGTLIPVLPKLAIPLTSYPRLQAWSERLLARPTWQTIQLSEEEWNDFRRHFKVLPRVWQRRRRQRTQILTS
ncbi:MAG TPA: glutathione S-transferase family protein [Leptolyngbyaceae cyanobacterium M33_DOE_097]|uniref:Glutathione S-transferase family protein n=1 Tax=Oscillatoriales cyanobacterium SpSt-418 TaxID=2282169 RepID=A0A7C3KBW9_9CYAN|nr:glutathione S-transferase family protein [Leptolyngbyaceae cyanobacterium M33_DOE_097]